MFLMLFRATAWVQAWGAKPVHLLPAGLSGADLAVWGLTSRCWPTSAQNCSTCVIFTPRRASRPYWLFSRAQKVLRKAVKHACARKHERLKDSPAQGCRAPACSRQTLIIMICT